MTNIDLRYISSDDLARLQEWAAQSIDVGTWELTAEFLCMTHDGLGIYDVLVGFNNPADEMAFRLKFYDFCHIP